MSRQFTWTKKQKEKLSKVRAVLNEFQEYKPLTLRQIFYQLVGKDYIPNTRSQYNMLSNLLKWARLDGYVSWNDLEDRVRAHHSSGGYENKAQFISQEMVLFLRGYHRNRMQSQKKHIEIWIEKDALSSIFTKVAETYGISVVVCRGFSSVSFLNNFKKRLEKQEGKKPVMLYFGDFDPSGVEMLNSMQTTLEDEMFLDNITFKRIALMEEDIFKYELPHNPDALKRTDTRAKKHLKAYGELAVELDALRPDILEEKIKHAIVGEINVPRFMAELEKEKQERDELWELKDEIDAMISERIKEE